ncbi:hypothetical protein BHYA_0154g00110 [Botrytis hyacinthi]|uniref:Uncharacterized protein n=1 Tax=Botrytis hyacinthi TaxID=278943 RepID=A0A4Z1GK00_9HELO|nr:hypothetical protein BHYA_0154g00110 [Botrytis hyacinthi]
MFQSRDLCFTVASSPYQISVGRQRRITMDRSNLKFVIKSSNSRHIISSPMSEDRECPSV